MVQARNPSRAWRAPEQLVDALVAILIVVLFGVVVLVISAPLRAARRSGVGEAPIEESTERVEYADRADLQAAREAKYREIRDAEMDYRTGKLSQEDYAAVDGVLRAEAVEILDRLTALGGEEPVDRSSGDGTPASS